MLIMHAQHLYTSVKREEICFKIPLRRFMTSLLTGVLESWESLGQVGTLALGILTYLGYLRACVLARSWEATLDGTMATPSA